LVLITLTGLSILV